LRRERDNQRDEPDEENEDEEAALGHDRAVAQGPCHL
jgi:hypothetical protein